MTATEALRCHHRERGNGDNCGFMQAGTRSPRAASRQKEIRGSSGSSQTSVSGLEQFTFQQLGSGDATSTF